LHQVSLLIVWLAGSPYEPDVRAIATLCCADLSKSIEVDRRLCRRSKTAMQGFITESELTDADQEFPGIARFFATLAVKPLTFLELVAKFDHWCDGFQLAATAQQQRQQ
jgi:hypothetical protein